MLLELMPGASVLPLLAVIVLACVPVPARMAPLLTVVPPV